MEKWTLLVEGNGTKNGKHFDQNLHYYWKAMKDKLRLGKLRLYCGVIGSGVCIGPGRIIEGL